MNRLFLIFILFTYTLHGTASQDIIIKSPLKKVTVKIGMEKTGLKVKVYSMKEQVVTAEIGIHASGGDVGPKIQIRMIKKSSTDELWNPVYGERSQVRNSYNEGVISLNDPENSGMSMQLICRVYDEGIAFRYQYDSTMRGLVLTMESTYFHFDTDYEAWVSDRAQSAYRVEKISHIETACERPLVIKRNDHSYLALGEAALVDFARMKLIRHPDMPQSLAVVLDGEVDLQKAGYLSPWRYVMVAESPVKLLENNYFIENLNEPNQLKDISWIKPGKIIREVTLTTQGGMACVDFAAKHNLQYVEFDAGWYGNEYDDQSDATTITVDPKRSPGPLELLKVIEYAKSRNIGVILYVNRRALEKQLDEVLPLLQSWGVKGIKYGFVNVGPQDWTSWLHDAVRKAADHKLMVDIHDEYRPTGYSRTYPNLMTQEGIRGDEESPTIEHSLITLFTRMIAGAGDNTNCYLAPRIYEKMGGKAAQMAKAVMLYSPWQFVYWYDRPEGSPHKTGGAGAAERIIQEGPDLAFYDALPTTWDETIVLEGEIGEYATIARKSGTDWFIGSLNAGDSRTVKIPLIFLDKMLDYEAVIYSQNEEDLRNNKVRIETIEVNHRTVLSRDLFGNSGFAIIINKK